MIVISIVMPVYNKEKYVHSILKDLQKQTFPKRQLRQTRHAQLTKYKTPQLYRA